MINKQQYLEICRLLNNIVKSQSSNLRTISIPWLHVIREHPIILSKYQDIYYKTFINFFKYNLKNYLVWSVQIFKSLFFIKNRVWYGSNDYEKNIDYLFISHLINDEQFTNKEDLYFGAIPNELKSRKYKVAIASIPYINGINHKSNYPYKKYNYYFSNSLSFSDELIIHKSLAKESRRLKKLSKKSDNKLEKLIYKLASIHANSNGSHFNLRLHSQLGLLLKKINPKIIITTYEGHAYERLIYNSAKSFNPKIKCIAYQHTGVFKLSNAIKIKLSNKYNPDYIFTSGLFGKQDLTNSKDLSNIKILEFGSNRGLMKLEKKSDYHHSKIFSCLVIPEVFISECNYLFNFSLKCAIINPKINFIWRLHPGISFKKLLKKNKFLQKLPNNIQLSTNPIENDIAKCKWVLYRGSSAIFKAISYGLRPIYLENFNEISIDPLFRLDFFKKNISNPDELISLIESDIKNNFINQKSNLDKIRLFCTKQFSKINLSVIENFL